MFVIPTQVGIHKRPEYGIVRMDPSMHWDDKKQTLYSNNGITFLSKKNHDPNSAVAS